MIRVVLTQLALFALPFLFYFSYRVATRGWTGARVSATGNVVFTLSMIGVGLVLAGFVYLAVTGTQDEGVYVPAQYRDGEIIPGGFRPREE